MSYHLHHIHIVCRDLEGMIEFFGRTFQAGLVKRKTFGGAAGAVLDLGGSAVNLRVAQRNEVLRSNDKSQSYGYHHIGVTVADIAAEYERLSAAGHEFLVAPTDIGELWTAFLKGPEGIVIELVQPAKRR
jgi:catechol 2,3-dioxygenase-like lactoylglutathione lyase family enzyme